MRIYYSTSLVDVIDGREDWLNIVGRFVTEISDQTETALKVLPKEITRRFNIHEGVQDQLIDYFSDPVIYMPNEFRFQFSIEHLGRLSREMLVRILPLDLAAWEPLGQPISALWIGGMDEYLDRAGVERLFNATREIWKWPVRGKVFVLGKDISDLTMRAAMQALIREVGGVVQTEVSAACDYYVTNDPEEAERARSDGARLAIDILTTQVLTSARNW